MNPPQLVIGQSQIEFPVVNLDNGCDVGSLEVDHSFNGRAFVVNIFSIDVTYTIQSVSETQFSWKDNFNNYTETYAKVQ
ncbi:MAG: hypothetical protein KI790_09200 [Cyclobacteriaceae bacterium]|nr:hypothetical protein [Cyclobacteriaceae bacterium HetDA_MAG_MS6]